MVPNLQNYVYISYILSIFSADGGRGYLNNWTGTFLSFLKSILDFYTLYRWKDIGNILIHIYSKVHTKIFASLNATFQYKMASNENLSGNKPKRSLSARSKKIYTILVNF